MWLARIEPDKPDHDLRTFECPTCEHTETKDVKFTYRALAPNGLEPLRRHRMSALPPRADMCGAL